MHVINIAADFSATPGARHKEDGPSSGQEFKERFLEPLFKNKEDNSKIKVILDGVEGSPTSFLEEAFGGLARDYGKDRCLKRLEFVSNEDPLLIEEITKYINDCKKEG